MICTCDPTWRFWARVRHCPRHSEANVAQLEDAMAKAAYLIEPPNKYLGNAHEILRSAWLKSRGEEKP
jgi:hypothetical protein